MSVLDDCIIVYPEQFEDQSYNKEGKVCHYTHYSASDLAGIFKCFSGAVKIVATLKFIKYHGMGEFPPVNHYM